MSVTSENVLSEKKPCTKGHAMNDPVGIYIQDTATATENRLEAGRSLQEGEQGRIAYCAQPFILERRKCHQRQSCATYILNVGELFTQKRLILSYECDGWF